MVQLRTYFGTKILGIFKNLTDMFCFFPRKIWENWLWQWCPLVPVSTIHSLDHFHKAMEIFLTKFYQMVQIRFHHTEHQNPVHVIGMVLRNRTTIFTVIRLMRKLQKYEKTVFCYQNCSDLLWEKIVLVIWKNFWNPRICKTFWEP